MLMCMESMYVVVGCNVVAIEHGRCSLSETVSSAGSAWYVVSFKCCEILLLLNIADMDSLLYGRLCSEQC